MKKKNKKMPMILAGLAAVFFAFRSKTQGQGHKTNNINTGQQTTAPAPAPATITQELHQEGLLSGRQILPIASEKGAKIEKITEIENAPISWNFGMIAKTSKKWAGEFTSLAPVKTFINRYAGLAALFYLLWVYIHNRKLNTIEKIGNTWASRNKEAWISTISEYSGFGKDDILKADSEYIFVLAYAIALYYQPTAKKYLSKNVFMVALDYLKNYKITLI